MPFKDAVDEEFELAQVVGAEEPLLPQHSHDGFAKPRSMLPPKKRRCNFMVLCALLALVILLPSLGLAGCALNEQRVLLPDKLNQWLGKEPAGQGAFPTNIGYPGPTVTGVEAGLIVDAPALPAYSNVAPLVPPKTQKSKFNIMQHWGNLSPYYSVESHGLSETSSLKPEQCEIVGLHWLQRHGARYPTSNPNGPSGVASRLKAVKGWKASGDLAFLNDWDFKLGAELLTPFGRQQLFNLGVSARMKYGFLLEKFGNRLPVFRTETQDRMLRSAQNFATGFFGYPAEEHFNLEVMVESPGFNCSLSPYHSCPNDAANYPRTYEKLAQWEAVFLRKAKTRLQKQLDGYDLSFHDIRNFMEMCAYETVAVGYSAFCPLFTQKEWKGFEYHNDLYWWNAASFGSPTARASGLGWVQETVARLTHTGLTEFNSTTNSTLHDDVHFPLNDPIYIDFTHDTTFTQLLPMMNLTSFAATGDLPTDHIPKGRSFVASKICPFATNMQLQVLKCDGKDSIRIILNDAVVPLTGIRGCPEDDDGICPLDAFVSAMQTLIGEVDFARDCNGAPQSELPADQSEPMVDSPESQGDGETEWQDDSSDDSP